MIDAEVFARPKFDVPRVFTDSKILEGENDWRMALEKLAPGSDTKAIVDYVRGFKIAMVPKMDSIMKKLKFRPNSSEVRYMLAFRFGVEAKYAINRFQKFAPINGRLSYVEEFAKKMRVVQQEEAGPEGALKDAQYRELLRALLYIPRAAGYNGLQTECQSKIFGFVNERKINEAHTLLRTKLAKIKGISKSLSLDEILGIDTDLP